MKCSRLKLLPLWIFEFHSSLHDYVLYSDKIPVAEMKSGFVTLLKGSGEDVHLSTGYLPVSREAFWAPNWGTSFA